MSRLSPQKKRRRGSYFSCEKCSKEFYVFPCEVKKAEKHGHAIRYCSASCYDASKFGDGNPFWGKRHAQESIEKMSSHPNRPRFGTGKDNPNFLRFGEEYGFKGSRMRWWRRKLLRDVGKCERCEMSDTRILTLHHIDKDRSNNTRENLLLLCWNCHALWHYEDGSGPYHFRTMKGRTA